MSIFLPWAAFAVAATAQTSGAGPEAVFCAFEVKVTTPLGVPVGNLPVVLVAGRKEVVAETVTDGKGMARICDAPLAFVDVIVGRDVCGAVRVDRLKFEWPETQRVFVTFVGRPCDHFGVSPERHVLLRVQDEQGRPVAGAQLELKRQTGRGSVTSDAFGRIFRVHRTGESIVGVVSKDKIYSGEVSVTTGDDVERTVVLKKR